MTHPEMETPLGSSEKSSSLSSLHPFPEKILNIPSPYWMFYPSIKWASIKQVNPTRERLLCLWSSHSLCHHFTRKLSFILNSVLGWNWIISYLKPRTHSGSWNFGSLDPENTCIVSLKYPKNIALSLIQCFIQPTVYFSFQNFLHRVKCTK